LPQQKKLDTIAVDSPEPAAGPHMQDAAADRAASPVIPSQRRVDRQTDQCISLSTQRPLSVSASDTLEPSCVMRGNTHRPGAVSYTLVRPRAPLQLMSWRTVCVARAHWRSRSIRRPAATRALTKTLVLCPYRQISTLMPGPYLTIPSVACATVRARGLTTPWLLSPC
jgi:hypothetical protein